MQMEQMLPMGPTGDGSNVGVSDWTQNYRDRAGESLNLAANSVTDVLYSLNVESGRTAEAQTAAAQTPAKGTQTSTPTKTNPAPVKSVPITIDPKYVLGAVPVLMIILLILHLVFKGKGKGKGKERRSKRRK